jgi:hypothetical protein
MFNDNVANVNNSEIENDKILDDEDEIYGEMGIFLKNNYTLDDFLNFHETRFILQENARWDCEKNLDEDIEMFYKGEVEYSKKDLSNIFSLEDGHSKLGDLQTIIYTNLKPRYNLEIFYLQPILAKKMVESYDERKKENTELRLQNIRNEYNKTINANKEYNWKNKMFK